MFHESGWEVPAEVCDFALETVITRNLCWVDSTRDSTPLREWLRHCGGIQGFATAADTPICSWICRYRRYLALEYVFDVWNMLRVDESKITWFCGSGVRVVQTRALRGPF